MGVSHSMQRDQVDKVLTEFEATTTAIRGIEEKVSRVEGYVKEAENHRRQLTEQTEAATSLLDNMTRHMNEGSDNFLQYFIDNLEIFADLMEELEATYADFEAQTKLAPSQVQKDMGPLLIPVLVLVLIVTVSNVVFGFLLANDPNLTDSLSFEAVFGSKTAQEDAGVNVLSIFAIFHSVLIGMAIVYLVFECLRSRHGRKDRTSTGTRETASMTLQNEAQEDASNESDTVGAQPDVNEDSPQITNGDTQLTGASLFGDNSTPPKEFDIDMLQGVTCPSNAAPLLLPFDEQSIDGSEAQPYSSSATYVVAADEHEECHSPRSVKSSKSARSVGARSSATGAASRNAELPHCNSPRSPQSLGKNSTSVEAEEQRRKHSTVSGSSKRSRKSKMKSPPRQLGTSDDADVEGEPGRQGNSPESASRNSKPASPASSMTRNRGWIPRTQISSILRQMGEKASDLAEKRKQEGESILPSVAVRRHLQNKRSDLSGASSATIAQI